MMRWRRDKGQATLEYILVLLVIILAIIAAANGPIKTAIGKVFDSSKSRIESAASQLTSGGTTSTTPPANQ